jgi:hypothetical protein
MYIQSHRDLNVPILLKPLPGSPWNFGRELSGIDKGASRDRHTKCLNAALTALKVWPFELAAALEYGRMYAELLRLGDRLGPLIG